MSVPQSGMEVIWLLGKLTPDFKTIADFRKDNLKPLRAVNRQFTVLCRKLELFGGQLLAIDGSKFGAVNARDQNFNALKLQDLIGRADARLAEYLQALDTADATEPASAALNKTQLAEKIAALQEKQDWHKELLAQLDDEQKQISATDPDTRKMPTAHGMIVGYNAQVAVDAKHKLIAADDVTNEVTDYKQLASVAIAAKANLEFKQAEVVADAGYYPALRDGGSQPVCRARHHALHSQGRHQREHGAGVIWQEPVSVRCAEGCVCVPAGSGVNASVQHV
jgi:transposase